MASLKRVFFIASPRLHCPRYPACQAASTVANSGCCFVTVPCHWTVSVHSIDDVIDGQSRFVDSDDYVALQLAVGEQARQV
jgi:hypothetical protein